MKYHVDGFVVSRGASFVSVADGLHDARSFAAELNRLAEERDALLAACKQARFELPSRFRYAVKTLDEAIRKAEGGAA